MTYPATAIIVLFLAACSLAQVKSVGVGQPIQDPANPKHWTGQVHNSSRFSLDAVLVTYDCPDGRGLQTIYDDLFSYPFQRAIPAGDDLKINNAADPKKCPGKVRAAIFADGHTEGSRHELERLYDRRNGAYTELVEIIPLLQALGNGSKSLKQVLSTMEASLVLHRQEETSNAVGYTSACLIVGQTLQNGYNLPVPSDRTPDRLPKPEDLVASDGITLNQARAIVLSKKLEEWQSALKQGLEPPKKQVTIN